MASDRAVIFQNPELLIEFDHATVEPDIEEYEMIAGIFLPLKNVRVLARSGVAKHVKQIS